MTPAQIEALRYHPACLLLPEYSEVQKNEMKASLRATGLAHPIKLLRATDGGSDWIVDGRNRHICCLEADDLRGLLRFEYWTEKDYLQKILHENLLPRRELTTSQRAMFAAKLVEMSRSCANLHTEGDGSCANLHTKDAAAAAGVSKRSVDAALQLRKDAPELADEVDAGETSLHAATQRAKETRDEKLASIQDQSEELRKRAAEALEERKRKASHQEPGWDQITDIHAAVGRGKEQEAQLRQRLRQICELEQSSRRMEKELQELTLQNERLIEERGAVRLEAAQRSDQLREAQADANKWRGIAEERQAELGRLEGRHEQLRKKYLKLKGQELVEVEGDLGPHHSELSMLANVRRQGALHGLEEAELVAWGEAIGMIAAGALQDLPEGVLGEMSELMRELDTPELLEVMSDA